MQDYMIRIKDLVKIYNEKHANEYKALKGVSFDIRKGEMVAVIGKSGAGKSTLLHVIGCIDSYESGDYYLDDVLIKDLSEKKMAEIRNQNIGIIMQDFALIEDFTALENVMIPLDFSKSRFSSSKMDIARDALNQVGLMELCSKTVNKLSGGQKQRVAIARALANKPQLILADEPTGALDSKTSDEIVQLLRDLNEKGRTVVIVTHEANVAESCDRVIEILDGKIKNG